MTLRKILITLTATLVLFVIVPSAQAQGKRISILVSLDLEPYREMLTGFQNYLKDNGQGEGFDVYFLGGDMVTANNEVQKIQDGKTDTGLLFTIGTLATDSALERIKDIPIVAGMILTNDKLRKSRNATGVSLEFPVEKEFEMLSMVIPGAKNIGVIYNQKENNEKIVAASKVSTNMGLTLDAHEVNSPQDLPGALDMLGKSADVLWGIPDKLVLTPQTARNILLFSYRNSIPFIGISREWVKAGALYSLDRDYSDIGRQCGEMALKILQGTPVHSLPLSSPRKTKYFINLKAAKDLKMEIKESVIRNADGAVGF